MSTRLLAAPEGNRQLEAILPGQERHPTTIERQQHHGPLAGDQPGRRFARHRRDQGRRSRRLGNRQRTEPMGRFQRGRDLLQMRPARRQATDLDLLEAPHQPALADRPDVIKKDESRLPPEPPAPHHPGPALGLDLDSRLEEGRINQATQPPSRLRSPLEGPPEVELRHRCLPPFGRATHCPADDQGQRPTIIRLDPEPARDAPALQRPVRRIEVDVTVESPLGRVAAQAEREGRLSQLTQDVRAVDRATELG